MTSIDSILSNADWPKKTWDIYYKGELVTDLETLTALFPNRKVEDWLKHPGLPLELRKEIEKRSV